MTAPAPSDSSAPAGAAAAPVVVRSRFAKGNVLLGFARCVRMPDGRLRFRVLWARLGVALALFFFVGWLTLATAAWSFVRLQRDVTSVNFFDIALPFRWKEYQRKRGNDYIERAKAASAAGKYREAFQLLRVGVAKSPANLDGREQLAQIYSLSGRADLGLTVLEEGKKFAGDNLEYLKTLIGLLFANQQDERVKQMAAEELPALSEKSERARVLAQAGAMACYFRGNYDQAEDYLKRYELLGTKDAQLLLARSDWERGYHELAIHRLRSIIQGLPADEDAYALLFSYLRDRKRTNEAAQLAVLRNITFPKSLGARIGLLFVYADKGERARIEREVDAIVRDVGNDPRALSQVAEFAIVTADVPLADRIRAAAATHELPGEIGALAAIHARIAARDYAGALAQIDAVNAEKPDWLGRHASAIAGLEAIAQYGIGRSDLGDLYLKQFLDQRAVRVEDLLIIATRLRAANANEASRRVLSQAAASDSLNQAALIGLVTLDLDANNIENLPRNIERLLEMRKPPADLLKRAYERLGSDTLLFSAERARVMPKLRAVLAARAPRS